MDDHPAEACFDSIRNKKPAHFDHKRVGNNGDQREGGSTGFNLQDGTAAGGSEAGRVTVRPHERNAPTREPPSPPTVTHEPPMNATEGGVDLQVPPVNKYQSRYV